MSEELKPCPFCDKEPAPYWNGVGCVTSGCVLNGLHLNADKWNRRAQPAEAEGIKTWRERIVAAHPKSEPGYWPDALLVEHMLPEIEELRAALSAVTAERDRVLAEREGKVLAPTEPTEAMLTAYSTNPNHVASAGAIYRAMLSAAMAAKEA